MPAAPPPVPKQVMTPPTELNPQIKADASMARERAMRGGRQSTILSALGGGDKRSLLGG